MSVKNSASKENYVRVSIWEVCKQGLLEMLQDITKFLLKPAHYASNNKVKYKLNENFLQSLRDLHENVEKLEPLNRKPLCGKKEFMHILRDTLGEDKAAEYAPLILSSCEKKQKISSKLILSVLLPLILILVVIFLKISIIKIPTGNAGILYKPFSGGTVIHKVYSEGLHMVFPWNIMYVYNTRIQKTSMVLSLWTINTVNIRIFVSVFCHPKRKYLGFIHRDIGPDYVNKIIIPQTTEAYRKSIGRIDIIDLITGVKSFFENIENSLSEKLLYNYITLERCIITKIEIPPEDIEFSKIYSQIKMRILIKNKKIEEAELVSKANKILSKSLTPEILKLKAIEKGMNPFYMPEKKEASIPAKIERGESVNE